MNEFLKTLLDAQNSNYQVLFYVLIGITTILLAASFISNYYIANTKIKNEIETQKNRIEVELATKMINLSNNFKEEVKKEFKTDLLKIRFDNARTIGYINFQNKKYDSALDFFITALELIIEIDKNNHWVRDVINGILSVLNQKDFKTYDERNFNHIKAEVVIKNVPDNLKPEKEEILKKLNNLKSSNEFEDPA